ncbi:site-specific integrase [Janthinobacterium sp.]|uniref:tyrosine-type recombinase/integrase n=1 Tax=Janthinobacterium sp. TaxID=1871054 RepID=UPI00293D35EB|nr:site-specific integrase [Janthinobacterium sp.]
MKSKSQKVEKNIYLENRNGSLRYIVSVSPFPKDAVTFSENEKAQALTWARRRRVELLEARESGKNVASPQPTVIANPAPVAVPELILQNIKLSDVFATFKELNLDTGHGSQSDHSRLSKLQHWFGEYTLGQFDFERIEKWRHSRLKGELGSGRNPKRCPSVVDKGGKVRQLKANEKLMDGDLTAAVLTKQQKHSLKKKGVSCAPEQVFPVTSQTVRHELMLVRRCLKFYFEARSLTQNHASWLAGQYVMRMELPSAAEARTRRMDDEELNKIIGALPADGRDVIVFALLAGLRRSEIVSLRWEDFSPDRAVIRLNNPGYANRSKTKVVERDVPLLPGAVKLLLDLQGAKKEGTIFNFCPGSVSQIWRRAADKVGAFDARLHDGRREALSRLVEQWGASLSETVLVSGHKDIATLQKHYIRLVPTVLAAKFASLPAAQQPRIPGSLE